MMCATSITFFAGMLIKNRCPVSSIVSTLVLVDVYSSSAPNVSVLMASFTAHLCDLIALCGAVACLSRTQALHGMEMLAS